MKSSILERLSKLTIVILIGTTIIGCTSFENHKGEKFPFKVDVKLADKPAPTVIVSHGGSCRVSQDDAWADRFKRWGYNTVLIDHCSARYITPHTGVEPPPLKQQDRVNDYIATAEWIRTQKWHEGKIAVFGISRGGEAVLRAAEPKFRNVRRGSEGLAEIDVYIALYPACSYFPKEPRGPLLIMHGELDNLAVFSTCDYSSLKHQNYTIKTYPGAYHGFDVAGCNSMGSNRYLGSYVSCRYNQEVAERSIADTKAFLDKNMK